MAYYSIVVAKHPGTAMYAVARIPQRGGAAAVVVSTSRKEEEERFSTQMHTYKAAHLEPAAKNMGLVLREWTPWLTRLLLEPFEYYPNNLIVYC